MSRLLGLMTVAQCAINGALNVRYKRAQLSRLFHMNDLDDLPKNHHISTDHRINHARRRVITRWKVSAVFTDEYTEYTFTESRGNMIFTVMIHGGMDIETFYTVFENRLHFTVQSFLRSQGVLD